MGFYYIIYKHVVDFNKYFVQILANYYSIFKASGLLVRRLKLTSVSSAGVKYG